MVSLVFFDILQLPYTVISNSEKLTHPIVQDSAQLDSALSKRLFELFCDLLLEDRLLSQQYFRIA